jgi:cobalamin biosynthesis protein CobT
MAKKKIGFDYYDWFSRDADYGYTSYDPTKRTMHWEKGYDTYSDFFFGKKNGSTKKINMQDSASLLLTMSRVMGTNSDHFSHSSMDSKKIHIPTDMLASGLDMDLFIGASLQNIAEFMHQTQEERIYAKTGAGRLSKTVYNILNAERVNKLMADDTPGYLKFVSKYKTHKYKDRPEVDPEDSNQRLVELFDRIIRYPEQITEEEMEEFKEPLEKIKDIIDKSDGIPVEYGACKKMATKITKVLQEYIKFDEEPPPPSEKGGDDGSTGGESIGMDDSEATDGDDKTPSRRTEDSLKKFLEKLRESMKESDSSDSKVFKDFIEEMKHSESTGSSKEHMGKVDYCIMPVTSYAKSRYQRAIAKIDRLKANVIANLLKRKNRDYQFSLKSMRTGRLDTNKLAEAKQMVPNIYERMGSVKTDKLCVSILVDESGSMSGSGETAAREAAIFLNEAMKGVPDVELFIYGHTADYHEPGLGAGGSHRTQLLVYKEPGVNNEIALGSIGARCENRDGVAMMAAAKRVRARTSNHGVFIIISDGSPSAIDYRGEAARTHVRRMANEIEKMGFEVVQVTIGGYRSKDMFKNVVDMDDISTFPTTFVSFLKKKINSLIKEKVTL